MRSRGTIALGVVALALWLGACARQSPEMAEADSAATAAAPAAAPEMPPANLARRPPSAPPPDTATQLQSAVASQDDPARKFIRTATVEFRVREVYRAALAIEDLAARHGGFVTRNHIETQVDDLQTRSDGAGQLVELATYTVRGNLQVRVPSPRTQEFLRAMASQVEFLDRRNYDAEDAQFELLRQQLAQARHQAAQQALGAAASARDRLRDKSGAIAARADAQGQRDEALIAQKTFEDRVAFATIDLAIHQSPQVRRTERMDVEAVVRRDGPGFFARLGHALREGWFGLLDAAIGLAQLWPLWLVVAAAIGVVRMRRRRS